MDPRMTGLPRGIAVLTAWLEADRHDDSLVWDEILASVEEGAEAEVEMTVGLFKLASILLVRAAGAEGVSERDILQDLARRYTS